MLPNRVNASITAVIESECDKWELLCLTVKTPMKLEVSQTKSTLTCRNHFTNASGLHIIPSSKLDSKTLKSFLLLYLVCSCGLGRPHHCENQPMSHYEMHKHWGEMCLFNLFAKLLSEAREQSCINPIPRMNKRTGKPKAPGKGMESAKDKQGNLLLSPDGKTM